MRGWGEVRGGGWGEERGEWNVWVYRGGSDGLRWLAARDWS